MIGNLEAILRKQENLDHLEAAKARNIDIWKPVITAVIQYHKQS